MDSSSSNSIPTVKVCYTNSDETSSSSTDSGFGPVFAFTFLIWRFDKKELQRKLTDLIDAYFHPSLLNVAFSSRDKLLTSELYMIVEGEGFRIEELRMLLRRYFKEDELQGRKRTRPKL